jgi:hypothetical protein
MVKTPSRIPDDAWRYVFPQETAYNMGKARQIEDMYHPGEKRDFIEENPSLVIGGGALAGGLGGYALKDYLLKAHPGIDNNTVERTLLSLGLAGTGAAAGAALTNYLLVKPKIDAANRVVESLSPQVEKKAAWSDNIQDVPITDARDWWEKTKDALGTSEKAMLYGAGTAAVLAGGAYLYDKDMFKKWAHDKLLKLEKRLKKTKFHAAQKGDIVQHGASMSLGGPGVFSQVKNIPLGTSVHTTGAGISGTFTSKDIRKALGYVPFVSKKDAKTVESYLPPKMYAGLEASVLGNPFAAGLIVNRQNMPQSIERIQKLRGLLRHRDIEHHVDKAVYGGIKKHLGAPLGLTSST